MELGAIGARHHALGPMMIDRSAGKIRELGAGVWEFGLAVLIGIGEDGVRVRHGKIMANQRDAEGRIEVIQQDRSYFRNAVTVGVAQQRNAVSALGLGAGEPLDPAGDDVLGAADRRWRTVALTPSPVAVGQTAAPPPLLKTPPHSPHLPPPPPPR